MVPLTYTQWLQVNKNNGNVANLASLQVFYGKYVKPEMDRLKEKASMSYWNSQADTQRAAMNTAIQAANFGQAQLDLDVLIGTLNGICRQLGEDFLERDPVARYNPATGWNSAEEAVQAMDTMAIAGALVPRPAKSGPDIPGIRWSTAKLAPPAGMPANLVNLIRDIRNAARAGGFVDERSQDQLVGRSITPKPPATLRSWHMNDQEALPAIDVAIPPGNALHAHYTATSKKPGNTTSKSNAPIGYAEYTGCGIKNDAHNVKLVLDYVQDRVYVTVTHYQRWDKSATGKYTIRDKTSGEHSAWFYIDFAM